MIDSNKLELEINRGISFQKKGENLKAKNIYLEIQSNSLHKVLLRERKKMQFWLLKSEPSTNDSSSLNIERLLISNNFLPIKKNTLY